MSRRLPKTFAHLSAAARVPMGAGEMCGVTVVSPGYEELAFHAVRRFHAATGMDTLILWTADEPAYFTKLLLPELVGARPIVFYDVDWWAQGEMDLTRWKHSAHFIGVGDRGVSSAVEFPCKDCERWDMDKSRYINTGFFICDLTQPLHRAVFQLARALVGQHLKENTKGMADHGEQSWLNLALHLTGVSVQLLPLEYNYFSLLATNKLAEKPKTIRGLHGAGIPAPLKLKRLLEEEGNL